MRIARKNKLIVVINILGLGIAISSCIVAFLAYNFNDSFDSYHIDSSQIYRVNSLRESQGKLTTLGYVPIPLGELIRQNVEDIESVVRYSGFATNFKVNENLYNTELGYVDKDFFRLFSFQFINGNPNKLSDKSQIFISEPLAVRFFGSVDAIGKIVTQLALGDQLRDFKVGGIYKSQPPNSSFKYDAYTISDNYWDEVPELKLESNWYSSNILFLKVKKTANIPSIQHSINQYVKINNESPHLFAIKEFQLEQFSGMAVRDQQSNTKSIFLRSASPTYVVAGTITMSVFLLLVACLNLTNSAFALYSSRSKEIGIRKILGSVRFELFFNVLIEVLLICMVSLMLSLFIATYLLVPTFNTFWMNIKLHRDKIFTSEIFSLTVVLIIVSVLTACYPVFYFNNLQPCDILNGKIKINGTSITTKTFLIIQLGLSMIAIIAGISFYENSVYQRDIDVGFNKKGVVYAWVNNIQEFERYRNALQENSTIQSIASSTGHLFISTYKNKVKYGSEEIEVSVMDVGDDYVKTIGLKLYEGRDFIRGSETDKMESVIITKKLADEFNWDKPIGKEIIWNDTIRLYVIGVVKDIYNNGLSKPLTPMMIRYTTPDKFPFVLVSGDVKKIAEINSFMEMKWKEVFPYRMYPGRFMDQEIMETISINNNIVRMSLFAGVAAMFLSLTGLFTHLSLTIARKMKEMGIRKVLGASTTNLGWLISQEFLIMLMIASSLSIFLGPLLIANLMSSTWSYYQAPSFTSLILSVSLFFAISLLTIIFKVNYAAGLNPKDILKEQ